MPHSENVDWSVKINFIYLFACLVVFLFNSIVLVQN